MLDYNKDAKEMMYQYINFQYKEFIQSFNKILVNFLFF